LREEYPDMGWKSNLLLILVAALMLLLAALMQGCATMNTPPPAATPKNSWPVVVGGTILFAAGGCGPCAVVWAAGGTVVTGTLYSKSMPPWEHSYRRYLRDRYGDEWPHPDEMDMHVMGKVARTYSDKPAVRLQIEMSLLEMQKKGGP
jgi:hypothetical protein